MTAERVAASLQWATVTIAKAKRDDSWANAPVAAGEGGQEPPSC